MEEEGEDGGNNVLGALAAHGEHPDGLDDAGGDGGDGEELAGGGDVGLDDVDLAALVWDDLVGWGRGVRRKGEGGGHGKIAGNAPLRLLG